MQDRTAGLFAVHQSDPDLRVLTPIFKISFKEDRAYTGISMASLVLRPSIKKAATILNNETHVRWWYRIEGSHSSEYQTPYLKQVRKGLWKMQPSRKYGRAAFLLPRYVFTRMFSRTDHRQECLLRFATITGFIGFLRPHTFRQLQHASFTVVAQNGDRRLPPNCIKASCKSLFTEKIQTTGDTILSLFINLKSQTKIKATAYFPRLLYR